MPPCCLRMYLRISSLSRMLEALHASKRLNIAAEVTGRNAAFAFDQAIYSTLRATLGKKTVYRTQTPTLQVYLILPTLGSSTVTLDCDTALQYGHQS